MSHFDLEQSPSLDLVNGVPQLSMFFSTYGPIDSKMADFVDAMWDEQDEEVTLTVTSPLSALLEKVIDFNRYVAVKDKVVVGAEQRELFRLVREDLVNAIKVIDAIEYHEDGNDR